MAVHSAHLAPEVCLPESLRFPLAAAHVLEIVEKIVGKVGPVGTPDWLLDTDATKAIRGPLATWEPGLHLDSSARATQAEVARKATTEAWSLHVLP
jgi:hypothetical protein